MRLLAYLTDGQIPALRAVHGMRHEVSKGVCCGVHSHRELEIVFHRAGSGVTRLGRLGEMPFGISSFVLYAPGQEHDQVMHRKGEDACLQFEVPAALRRDLQGALYVPLAADRLIVVEMEALTRDEAWANAGGNAVMNLRANAVLLYLIQHAVADVRLESMSPTQRHVAEADSYLCGHFSTIGSLQEVSDYVGLSPSRLRHLFQEQRGMSLIGRLNEIRLERACSLLVYSRLPIKQVASLSGFRDPYYFSAVFRRIHRMAPGAYRTNRQTMRQGPGKAFPRVEFALMKEFVAKDAGDNRAGYSGRPRGSGG